MSLKGGVINAHFAEANHNGENDWVVRLTEQANNVEEFRKREFFGNMSWMLFSLMD